MCAVSPARRAVLAATAAALSLAAQPAGAQAPAGELTIRLAPDDRARGQYGPQRNFYFLPPSKTAEADYQSAGFFGARLRPYLAGNAPALAELARYRQQKTLYLADKALLLSAVGLYGSQVYTHGEAVYFNGAQQAAVGAAALSLLATLFINRHTNEHLQQAVDDYNTALPPSSAHGAVWPRLRPAGVGLAASAGQPVLAVRWQL